MSETADPIGAALHADAEAARAEIRAAGVACPSCDVNMADLPRDHMLTMTMARGRIPAASRGREYEHAPARPSSAGCNYGRLANLDAAPFETWQAAANIALWDDFRRREDEAFDRLLSGDGLPGTFDSGGDSE